MADPETTTPVTKNPSGEAIAAKTQSSPKTTAEGTLSYVGWADGDADKTGSVAVGDGPVLSIRSTKKEPPNPVMAK